MTYNVSMGTLNLLTHSLTHSLTHLGQGGYVFIGVDVSLFICQQDYAKTAKLIFTKFG